MISPHLFFMCKMEIVAKIECDKGWNGKYGVLGIVGVLTVVYVGIISELYISEV